VTVDSLDTMSTQRLFRNGICAHFEQCRGGENVSMWGSANLVADRNDAVSEYSAGTIAQHVTFLTSMANQTRRALRKERATTRITQRFPRRETTSRIRIRIETAQTISGRAFLENQQK
jgi:hypothetical protein